jgi:hypothetical protein
MLCKKLRGGESQEAVSTDEEFVISLEMFQKADGELVWRCHTDTIPKRSRKHFWFALPKRTAQPVCPFLLWLSSGFHSVGRSI